MDRNTLWEVLNLDRWLVALRKESVDRNTNPGSTSLTFPVALRKESVDRNANFDGFYWWVEGRSPQGERG